MQGCLETEDLRKMQRLVMMTVDCESDGDRQMVWWAKKGLRL
jgi:hypothetical protein